MTEKVIQVGDKVEVWLYADGGDRLCSEPSKATILNMPRGEGDLIQVEYENGNVEAINPYAKLFHSIVRIK